MHVYETPFWALQRCWQSCSSLLATPIVEKDEMNELNIPPFAPPSPPASDDAPPSPTESEAMRDWEEALSSISASGWERTTPEKMETLPQLPYQQDLSSFVRSRPDVPLPELPLEVTLKILEHVFLRPSSTTPTSPQHALKGTTHVLLVSKFFTAIALPILYSSLTVSRPRDLATFFDSRRGIFIGEEGNTRWSMVKELCIMNGVQLPLEGDDLLPLTIPNSRRINRLFILEREERSFNSWDFEPPQLTREEEEQLAASQRRSGLQRERLNATITASLREEQIQEGQQHLSFEEWTYNRMGTTDFRSEVGVETMRQMWKESFNERRTLLNRIVLDASPRRLHLSLLAEMSFLPLSTSSRVETLVIHFAAPQPSHLTWPQLSQSPDVVEVAEEVANWLDLSLVHLVGFPRSDLDELVARVGREPSRIIRWTWEREDGSCFELNVEPIIDSDLELASSS